MAKFHKKPCGCYLETIGRMKPTIVFCPLHEHAADLLRVVQEWVDAWDKAQTYSIDMSDVKRVLRSAKGE